MTLHVSLLPDSFTWLTSDRVSGIEGGEELVLTELADFSDIAWILGAGKAQVLVPTLPTEEHVLATEVRCVPSINQRPHGCGQCWRY